MKFRTIPTSPAAFLATLLTAFLTIALCFFATGCSHDFNENTVRSRAAERQLQLDNEQVSLNSSQLSCGVDDDLWEGTQPAESSQPGIYRLTEKGRALQFSDDVYVNDPGYPSPFVQVRGKFYIQADRVVTIDTTSDGDKLVQAVLGVKIAHPCFTTPLPLMGIKKGKFTPDFAPTLKFENGEEGWWPTELVH